MWVVLRITVSCVGPAAATSRLTNVAKTADCRERAPGCSAAVSPGSCSLLLHIMRSLRSLEAEQHEYHNNPFH